MRTAIPRVSGGTMTLPKVRLEKSNVINNNYTMLDDRFNYNIIPQKIIDAQNC